MKDQSKIIHTPYFTTPTCIRLTDQDLSDATCADEIMHRKLEQNCWGCKVKDCPVRSEILKRQLESREGAHNAPEPI